MLWGGGESLIAGQPTYWKIGNTGEVEFKSGAHFLRGTQIIIDGRIIFGKNFSCNANCIINAAKEITFGDDFLMGWGGTVIDGDGHHIVSNGMVQDKEKNINIGNHVWCASNVTLLKGAVLFPDTIVASGAIVSKDFQEGNLLVGGTNKILKRDVNWIE